MKQKVYQDITDEQFNEIVQDAVAKENVISLNTYILDDIFEKRMNYVIKTVLEHFDRIDLYDVTYTAVKEMVVNATKASMKRLVFSQEQVNVDDHESFERGMKAFKERLTEEGIADSDAALRENDHKVTTTFYFNEFVLYAKVKNNFQLLELEEGRIRDKFNKSNKYQSLIDFYMDQHDENEGAGMGLTMTVMMLEQSGIDRHAFTIYSTEEFNETIARLEIPLSEEYIPKRVRFDQMLEETGKTPDELRKEFKYNPITFAKQKRAERLEREKEEREASAS